MLLAASGGESSGHPQALQSPTAIDGAAAIENDSSGTAHRGARSASAPAGQLVTVDVMGAASFSNQPPLASEPRLVAVDLVDATSVVRDTIDKRHVARLAEVLERCPPIAVAADGALVDGAHRLEAARRRGWETIPAVVLATSSRVELVLAAARANCRHGLPLTRAERQAIVAELLVLQDDLSDRAIAEACGVARSAVAAVRAKVQACSGGRSGHLNSRVGVDGKHYPIGPRDIGPLAAAIVRLDPTITVRTLASRLGVSTGTAHRHRAEALAHIDRERWLARAIRRMLARWFLWRRRRRAG